jgi:hypothetical protein
VKKNSFFLTFPLFIKRKEFFGQRSYPKISRGMTSLLLKAIHGKMLQSLPSHKVQNDLALHFVSSFRSIKSEDNLW